MKPSRLEEYIRFARLSNSIYALFILIPFGVSCKSKVIESKTREKIKIVSDLAEKNTKTIIFHCTENGKLYEDKNCFLITDTGNFVWDDLELVVQAERKSDEENQTFTFSINKKGQTIFKRGGIANLTKISRHMIDNEAIISFILFDFYLDSSNEGTFYSVNLSTGNENNYQRKLRKTCSPIYLEKIGWLVIDDLVLVILDKNLKTEYQKINILYDSNKDVSYLDTYYFSDLIKVGNRVCFQFSPHAFHSEATYFIGDLVFNSEKTEINLDPEGCK